MVFRIGSAVRLNSTVFRTLLALLGSALSVAIGYAQIATTGKITGIVTDNSGAVVANASITAKSTALFTPHITTSHSDGSYLLDLLPPGEYEVTVSQRGFRTFTQIGIVLTAGFTATVSPKLQVGEVTQVIEVQSEAAVDLENNQTSSTFDETLLQEIPSGRDPWSTVAQMPGTTSSTFDVAGDNSYQQSTMQVHGSTPAEQLYSYNGLDLNWPGSNGGYTQFYTNHDSFDEFQVVADNAPASVPIGGVYMNMVTKSGSNQWHGQALVYYLTGAWQAGVKFPTWQGSPVTSGSPFQMTRDASASLGGPIIKDRWWIFGSYRRYDLRQQILSVTDQQGNPVVDVNHQTNTDLRSDWQVNSKNKFSFIWMYNEQNRFFRRDTAYSFVTEQASWRQIEPAYILEGLWTSQVTNNLLLDFRVGWNKITFPLEYQSNATSLNVQDVALSTETGAAPYEFINPAWVLKWTASGSWYKSNLAGSHNFQFGFEWGKNYNSYIYRVDQGINVLLNNGAPYQVLAYNTPTTQKNYFRDTSFYLQDTWKVKPRLTLNLGLRYDRFTTYYPVQHSDPGETFPDLFPITTYPASGNLVDWNTVSPRLGLAYDVTGKGNSVLRFNYGRYYIMQGTGLAESANPVGLSGKYYSWTDSNGDGIPQTNEWLPNGAATVPVNAFGGSTTQANAHMSRPYSDQYSVAYERQVWSDLRIGVTYYYRTKKNLFGLENTAVSPSDYVPVSGYMNPLTNQPLTLYSFQPSDPSKYGEFNFLVTNISKLNTNSYNGLEFTAVKRFTHKWTLLSGFTIQRQKGVYGRGYSDEALSDNFTDPNNDINRNNNYLNMDATYVFKVDSIYELPWKLSTSINFQHYTGFPLQPTDTFTVPNGQGVDVGESVILQPGGIQRLPSVNMLNLRLSREFVIKDRLHLIPTADFFNVTNSQTVIGEVTTYGGSYLYPYSTINPYVTRFGLRVTF